MVGIDQWEAGEIAPQLASFISTVYIRGEMNEAVIAHKVVDEFP